MTTYDPTALADAIARHAAADGVHCTALSALHLSRASSPSEMTAVVYEPSLCVVAQGAKEVRLAGETYRYDASQSLLVSIDLPVSARVVEATPDRPCLMLRLALDPADVGELLADGGAPPSGAARGLSVCPLEPATIDAIARLVRLLDSPGDLPALSPLALREITYRVLTGPLGPRLRQIASAGGSAHRVARAVRRLKDGLAETLRVDALARQVGLSPSAFYAQFKGVTGMSPIQYQKRLRLQEARRLMLGEGLDAAEAAYRVGYVSPSQFSREYRRLFGAPPRRDVSAARG